VLKEIDIKYLTYGEIIPQATFIPQATYIKPILIDFELTGTISSSYIHVAPAADILDNTCL